MYDYIIYIISAEFGKSRDDAYDEVRFIIVFQSFLDERFSLLFYHMLETLL